MKVRVLFFGATHDITGRDEEQIELADGQMIEGVRREYEARFPKLAQMGGSLLIAVNQEIRESSWQLKDGDELAFLPPVSGGHEGNVRSGGHHQAVASLGQVSSGHGFSRAIAMAKTSGFSR